MDHLSDMEFYKNLDQSEDCKGILEIRKCIREDEDILA